MAAGLPTTIVLGATATDNGGNTTVSEVSLKLLAQQAKIAETTGIDGEYALVLASWQGQSLVGREVQFRINGIVVTEKVPWEAGGADEHSLAISPSATSG